MRYAILVCTTLAGSSIALAGDPGAAAVKLGPSSDPGNVARFKPFGRHDMSIPAFRAGAASIDDAVMTFEVRLHDRFPDGLGGLRQTAYALELREPGTKHLLLAVVPNANDPTGRLMDGLADGERHILCLRIVPLKRGFNAGVYPGWAVVQDVYATYSEPKRYTVAATRP